MIAGLGRSRGLLVPRLGRQFAKRGEEHIQMRLAQVADGGIREGAREPAKHDGPIVSILGGESRPLAVAGLGARFISSDEFLDRFRNILALHYRHGPQIPFDRFPKGRPPNFSAASESSDAAAKSETFRPVDW